MPGTTDKTLRFGPLLRSKLIEAVTPIVFQQLRAASIANRPLAADALGDEIGQAVSNQIDRVLGVDSGFWNNLPTAPTHPDQLKPVTDPTKAQYTSVGNSIGEALNRLFGGKPIPTNWAQHDTDIRNVIQNNLIAKEAQTKEECTRQIDEVIRQSGVTEEAKIKEAREKLLEAVLKRRDELAAQDENLTQFRRQQEKEKAEADDEKKEKKSAPEAQQQQQQQAAPSDSDWDSWLQQRKYQGQNLIVSMIISWVMAKGPLNIIDYIGCIATGGMDGLLRKWRMLEYQGMELNNPLPSEWFDPFYSAGKTAAANGGKEQGYATAAQAQAAQSAQQGQAQASRPQPK